MASSSDDKAEEWIQKGDQKLRGFSLFQSSQTKYEDAAEFYTKGANMYKMAKKCILDFMLHANCFK